MTLSLTGEREEEVEALGLDWEGSSPQGTCLNCGQAREEAEVGLLILVYCGGL